VGARGLAVVCGWWTEARLRWLCVCRSFVITQLTEGAMYEIEVEAAAKYIGAAAMDAPAGVAVSAACSGLDQETPVESARVASETHRSIDTASLTSLAASHAQSLVGIFSEQAGAEVRRGLQPSDADTEEWERTIDEFSRQALWDREAQEGAITARLSQRHSRAARARLRCRPRAPTRPRPRRAGPNHGCRRQGLCCLRRTSATRRPARPPRGSS
jgi:hypothetical protein